MAIKFDPKIIQAVHNKVLIEVHIKNHKVSFGEGIEVGFSAEFEPWKHLDTFVTVVSTPKTLSYTNSIDCLLWETSMDLKVGDKAIVDYVPLYDLLKQDSCYEIVDDKVYCFLRYDAFICAKRGDEYIPVNGYVLGKPLTEEKRSIFDFDVKFSKRLNEVVAIGTPVTQFLDNDGVSDVQDIEVGDIVITEEHCNRWLEVYSHKTLHNDELYVFQKRHIGGKVIKK